jgi:uncharacterized damage-inducible protein DinB
MSINSRAGIDVPGEATGATAETPLPGTADGPGDEETWAGAETGGGALAQPAPKAVPAAITNPAIGLASRARIPGAAIRNSFKETLMKRLIPIVMIALLCAPSLASAQANASQASLKAVFDMLKGNLSKTAEKVPEDVYAFKPTPEVRSFAQLIGHVADSHFSICAAAAGEKPTQSGIEKSATTKAALVKALNESIAYCDKVIAGMDDTKGVEVTKFFTGPTTRQGVLWFNTSHSYEHYGNLVTYMRLKGIVPPSSGGN